MLNCINLEKEDSTKDKMGKVTTQQKVIRAFESDVIKLRMLKNKTKNGNEESDADVLNRVLKDLDSKMKKINIKFDGVFNQ
jgi:hypothetical protein